MSIIMMKSENQPKYELDDLLLSAVRQGDANLLESHLSTVADPSLYLNHIYDETDNQKCTLLMIACLNRHDNVIYMVLHRFKLDLEVLNSILYKDANTIQTMFLNVSVLWVASIMNNFEVVKLLVEHGANVNHTTETNSTPLRGVCHNSNIDMARYLIKHGADIHIAKENNDTNLMLCVWRKHLNMVVYHLDELNCDVNLCSNDGRSPLYTAVTSGSLELVEFLLNRGARNFRATLDQMSPLMWAAERKCVDLVKAIYPYCTLLERIEAEELLGSAFICFQRDHHGIEQSFEHFYRALELRTAHNLPKVLRCNTIEIFDNRQECQTLDQLEEIRSNHDNMYTEALLVRERLLGPINAEYRRSLRYRATVLAYNKEYYRAIALWMHELELRRQYSILLYPDRLRQLASVFCKMALKSLLVPIEALLSLLTLTSEELQHNKSTFSYNLYTLLFLITITSQFLEKAVISTTDRVKFYRHLRTINQYQYTTPDFGLSLLHLSLDSHTSANDYYFDHICKYPCLHTARILLQCGADVNVIDTLRNTPLHTLVSNEYTRDGSIFKLLCDAGAHLDCVNALGETPIDLASNLTIKKLLRSRMKLSLKCLCARFIQKNSIPFHGRIITTLVAFVEKH